MYARLFVIIVSLFLGVVGISRVRVSLAQEQQAQGQSAQLPQENQTPAAAVEHPDHLLKHEQKILTVQGEISSLNRRYISVIFDRNTQTGDEQEILLPYNEKTVKLEHVQSVKELMKGDIVLITYVGDFSTYESGKEGADLKATGIAFVRRPSSGQDSGVLISQ